MSRLPAIQPQAATGKAKELLDAVQAKLKITPNMTRVMANSPALGWKAARRDRSGSWRTEFVSVLRIRSHGDRQNDRSV